MKLRRGDIVRAEDEEGAYTAVVVQTDMLTRLTVVVCMVTEVPIDVTLPIRVPLRARVSGVELPAQVIVDKPFTIACAEIKRVLRRMDYDELHELESGLTLLLGLAPRLVFYPFI